MAVPVGTLVAVTFVLAASLAVPAGGQAPAVRPAAPQPPPRDAQPPPVRTGTAAIRGRVVAADTVRPLRRVQLSVASLDLGGPRPRTTSTDEDGRYEIADLPGGLYTVTATRGGFLSLRYGQLRPREQARTIELVEGQVAENINLALPKASLISGRITDESGEPMAGVWVFAMRSIYFAGRRQIVPTSELVTTDDVGEYRIGGLAPGTYTVGARTSQQWSVDAAGDETMGYAPTYYPGTTTVTAAARVTVGVAQEARGTDFGMIPGRSATVSGTAFDSRGRPFPNVVMGLEIRGEGGGMFTSVGGVGRVAPDGTFTIRGVPPGDYKLRAARQDKEPEVAILPLVVNGIDITALSLVGSAGGTVSGRVVLDKGVTAKLPRVAISIRERLIGQPDGTMLGAFRNFGPTQPAEDGAFSVPNVFGPARVAVTAPDGWMVKSIVHDGRDIIDTPVQLRHGEQWSDVQVLLTDRVTSVSGELIDDKGARRTEGTVIVFAAESAKWFEESRFVRTARLDRQGRYEIKGLPAGNYLAVGMDFIEEYRHDFRNEASGGAWSDPEYLESLRRYAQKLSLRAGESQTLSLKLVTMP